jgi:hypothetical protein
VVHGSRIRTHIRLYVSRNKKVSPDIEIIFRHVLKGGPAGGGFSTVKDLHKFALSRVKAP